jgi:Xaa-Pro aminopeptidase
MDPFAERRRALLDRFEGGIAVLPSAPVAIRNNDVEHEYRQESDLYYLSGFEEPDSVLVVASAHPEHRAVLFLRPRDPERERWDGPRVGIEQAKDLYGVDAAYPIAELGSRLSEYLLGHRRLLYRFGRDSRMDDAIVAALGAARARARRGALWPTEIVDPLHVLHELRLFKSEVEIEAMKRAAEITRAAHVEAMRATRPGRYEYEIEAVLARVFRERGAERPAYPSIVGSGPNATILHYRNNRRQMLEAELLLVDAACEYRYYASDVTRTWPVSGVFSAPQRQIYEIVLRAQLASIDAVKPGATLDDVHQRSVEVILDGLLETGILRGDRAGLLAEEKHRPYFMHRTSHFLGMDVHDVGSAFLGKKPRPLEPGMVITVEPGIYLSPNDETVPAPFRGIGVRIEDDVLVTAAGGLNLTADVPKTVDEIERAVSGR